MQPDPLLLAHLGTFLRYRYDSCGEDEDLENSIQAARQAVELTSDSDPNKPERLASLGESLESRFDHTGDLADLESAIITYRRANELTPDNHPDKPRRLADIGGAFHTRYNRTRDSMDLEQAITLRRRAVDLTPDGHSSKPLQSVCLSGSFHARYLQYGHLADLSNAIGIVRSANESMLDSDPSKPTLLMEVGLLSRSRFEHTADLDDLQQAVKVVRHAIELTADGHSIKPDRLDTLAMLLKGYFKRTGDPCYIEDAIIANRRSYKLTPEGHPNKAERLGNVGDALRARFESTGDGSDLMSAFEACQDAVELTPDDHPRKPDRLDALACIQQRRFLHNGNVDDIENAIVLHHRAVELIPQTHPNMPVFRFNLSESLIHLFEHDPTQHHFEVAIACALSVMEQSLGSPSVRSNAAMDCMLLVRNHPKLCTTEFLLDVHARILSILPEIVWLGHSVQRRFEEIGRLGELIDTAVFAAIHARAFPQALEWLEAGRAFVWSQLLSLRTPLDELEERHPELAHALKDIHQELRGSASYDFPHAHLERGNAHEIIHTVDTSVADRHRQLVIQYERIVTDARSCAGFEGFLRPKKFEALIHFTKLSTVPVVFIHVTWYDCNALILRSGDVEIVELNDFTEKNAKDMRALWRKCLAQSGVRQRATKLSYSSSSGMSDSFCRVLEILWTRVVFPVLKALDFGITDTSPGSLPHVIWCPTGPLTQLPLHAAGIYTPSDQPGPRVFDMVVSSYTPSLSLFPTIQAGSEQLRPTQSIMVVTQPATPYQAPLPCTRDERDCLRAMFPQPEHTFLDHEQATLKSTLAVVGEHPWIHLACHGCQDVTDSTQSAFMLFDGPLTLSALMSTTANDAELAFLSACQTATGDAKISEESAHLAAGMLAVGFKGVIATMWSIRDDDAPVIVEAYYRELINLDRDEFRKYGRTGAADALHEATRHLREKVGEHAFERWVPFVHFGI
ncbi:TPR-like protein [Peniophora sp. CONT]|nr:TPR-like protein [Peniophora sp. CONT]